MAKYVYQKGQKPLTIEEIKYVRLHPTLGYAITSQNHYSDFIIKSILYHHENYDGSGFPSNLKEDEIPIGARILRICDVFGGTDLRSTVPQSFFMGKGGCHYD